MKRTNSNYPQAPKWILTLIIVGILCSACSKNELEILEPSNKITYFKLLPTKDELLDVSSIIEKADKDNYWLIGTAKENNNISIYEFDKYGHTQQLTSNILPDLAGEFYRRYSPRVAELDNGDLFFNSHKYNAFGKLNNEGEIVHFSPVQAEIPYSFGKPYLSKSKHLFFTYNFASPSYKNQFPNNFIREYSIDGALLNTFVLTDGLIKGTVIEFDIYKVENNVVWLIGSYLPFASKSSLRIAKTFFAKYSLANRQLLDLIEFDENDNSENDYCNLLRKIENDNNQDLVFISSTGHDLDAINDYSGNFELIRVNDEFETIWRTTVEIDALRTVPCHLSITKEGNSLISGWCLINNEPIDKPFMAYVDAKGNLKSHKVFDLGNSSQFKVGLETSDGYFTFSGNTRAFGNEALKIDHFVLKTDRNGKYNQK